MAVYKKNCWLVVFACLYLVVCSMTTVVTGTIEDRTTGKGSIRHHHHNHHHHQQQQQSGDDLGDMASQLERTSIEESSMKTPMQATCPNCLYNNDNHHHRKGGGSGGGEMKSQESQQQDSLRLEAIKRQILSKLGLRHKPNVTHSLPKEVIMETLFRAEDSSDFFRNFERGGEGNGGGGGEDGMSTTSARSSATVMETMDFDDFYGRTSEIISFAERGSRVNQNRLLEFRVSAEPGQAGQEFRVRTATLWLKADIRHRRPLHQCRATEIYVFKIISRLPESVTLSSQDFDRATSDPVKVSLIESQSGWQKLDLTDTVQKWLSSTGSSSSSSEKGEDRKLQLLVDCSCCSHWHIHLFNSGDGSGSFSDRKNNPNRPFLVIRTDPSTAKRVRRRALDCSADSGNQCCKQRFYVSFKQLGWDDWVIAPHGYYANYCRGDCGHHRTPDTYVTYHTHVIEEVRKTHHLSGMQPCCAPLKFSGMSLIYYGPDLTIIKRDLPKMVVDECGCP